MPTESTTISWSSAIMGKVTEIDPSATEAAYQKARQHQRLRAKEARLKQREERAMRKEEKRAAAERDMRTDKPPEISNAAGLKFVNGRWVVDPSVPGANLDPKRVDGQDEFGNYIMRPPKMSDTMPYIPFRGGLPPKSSVLRARQEAKDPAAMKRRLESDAELHELRRLSHIGVDPEELRRLGIVPETGATTATAKRRNGRTARRSQSTPYSRSVLKDENCVLQQHREEESHDTMFSAFFLAEPDENGVLQLHGKRSSNNRRATARADAEVALSSQAPAAPPPLQEPVTPAPVTTVAIAPAPTQQWDSVSAFGFSSLLAELDGIQQQQQREREVQQRVQEQQQEQQARQEQERKSRVLQEQQREKEQQQHLKDLDQRDREWATVVASLAQEQQQEEEQHQHPAPPTLSELFPVAPPQAQAQPQQSYEHQPQPQPAFWSPLATGSTSTSAPIRDLFTAQPGTAEPAFSFLAPPQSQPQQLYEQQPPAFLSAAQPVSPSAFSFFAPPQSQPQLPYEQQPQTFSFVSQPAQPVSPPAFSFLAPQSQPQQSYEQPPPAFSFTSQPSQPQSSSLSHSTFTSQQPSSSFTQPPSSTFATQSSSSFFAQPPASSAEQPTAMHNDDPFAKYALGNPWAAASSTPTPPFFAQEPASSSAEQPTATHNNDPFAKYALGNPWAAASSTPTPPFFAQPSASSSAEQPTATHNNDPFAKYALVNPWAAASFAPTPPSPTFEHGCKTFTTACPPAAPQCVPSPQESYDAGFLAGMQHLQQQAQLVVPSPPLPPSRLFGFGGCPQERSSRATGSVMVESVVASVQADYWAAYREANRTVDEWVGAGDAYCDDEEEAVEDEVDVYREGPAESHEQMQKRRTLESTFARVGQRKRAEWWEYVGAGQGPRGRCMSSSSSSSASSSASSFSSARGSSSPPPSPSPLLRRRHQPYAHAHTRRDPFVIPRSCSRLIHSLAWIFTPHV
ncbi:hypothetical protein C8J57DRAFT_521072 [Mycena rebaudengoi]|nr:hypothetical protein C8J57DRAFT_521072 [Mycena rebaudengoi]